MDFSKMSIEELREYCINSLEIKKQLENEKETLENKIKEHDKTITNLNNNVSELKQKNYDLFVKVTTPLEKDNIEEVKKDDVVKIDELINNMIGE